MCLILFVLYVSDLTWIVGVEQPKSGKIWAFLLGMFWVSFVTYYVLWKAYRRVVFMRDRAQANANARPQQYAALVRDIPKPVGKETRTQQVDGFFSRVHPGAYSRVQPVHNIRPVNTKLNLKGYSLVSVSLTNQCRSVLSLGDHSIESTGDTTLGTKRVKLS